MKVLFFSLLILVSGCADAQRRAPRGRSSGQQNDNVSRSFPNPDLVIGDSDRTSEARPNDHDDVTRSGSHSTASQTEDSKREGSGQPASQTVAPESGDKEPFSRQVPLCILVDVVDDPYDDRMRTGLKYGKTFIPRVG